MTKTQIEYILALAKLKNFGQAADACFISQSTLSAMVAKFEEQSGVEIFNRKTRPISITEQGDEVIKSLKTVYREYQLLEEKLNEIKGIELRELSIACIPTVAPYLYPLILNKISSHFPKVNITVLELTTENIVDEIKSGNIDVGIVSIPLDDNELIEYPIYDEEFLIYDCGNSLKGKKVSVSDIDIERLWLLEEGHCLRNQVGQICELRQQNKIHGNIVYSCGSIFTLIQMVKMNKGVTLLPKLATVKNSQIQPKYIYNFSKNVPNRKIGLISHKHFVKKRILSSLSMIIKDEVDRLLPKQSKKSLSINPF